MLCSDFRFINLEQIVNPDSSKQWEQLSRANSSWKSHWELTLLIQSLKSISIDYSPFVNFIKMHNELIMNILKNSKNIFINFKSFSDVSKILDLLKDLPEYTKYTMSASGLTSIKYKEQNKIHEMVVDYDLLDQIESMKFVNFKIWSTIIEEDYPFIFKFLQLRSTQLNLINLSLKLNSIQGCIKVISLLKNCKFVTNVDLSYNESENFQELIPSLKQSIRELKRILWNLSDLNVRLQWAKYYKFIPS